MVIRVALCGRSQAPDLFEVIRLFGKERVLERLKKAEEAL